MLRNVLRVVRMKTIPGVHERQTSTLPDFLPLLLDPGLPLSPPDQIGLLWVREDQRDRLGREVAAADQPLVSLKDVRVVERSWGRGRSSFGVVGSGR